MVMYMVFYWFTRPCQSTIWEFEQSIIIVDDKVILIFKFLKHKINCLFNRLDSSRYFLTDI